MKLLYFQGKVPNFGDDINRDMWHIYDREFFTDSGDQGFLGIGTLIGRSVENINHIHVFSSGAGYDVITGIKKESTYWCVRGPLTAKVLGLNPSLAIADAGILAPDVFGIKRSNLTSGISVVPHFESMLTGGWQEACLSAGLNLINPMNSPIDVISQIAASNLIVTESLHGAIIADVLRVPWIAFASTGNVSLFKWCDWANSVGVNLRMACIPPPNSTAQLKYGRPRFSGYGHFSHISENIALEKFSQFHDRTVQSSRNLRITKAKDLVKLIGKGQLDKILGLSPSKTGEFLARIAKAEPSLSRDGVLVDLQGRLHSKFAELRSLVTQL